MRRARGPSKGDGGAGGRERLGDSGATPHRLPRPGLADGACTGWDTKHVIGGRGRGEGKKRGNRGIHRDILGPQPKTSKSPVKTGEGLKINGFGS
jgi:hypothetical protein